MMFKREEIIEMANKDFEKAWLETKSLIKAKKMNESYPRVKPVFGKTHPVNDTIENLRQVV